MWEPTAVPVVVVPPKSFELKESLEFVFRDCVHLVVGLHNLYTVDCSLKGMKVDNVGVVLDSSAKPTGSVFVLVGNVGVVSIGKVFGVGVSPV